MYKKRRRRRSIHAPLYSLQSGSTGFVPGFVPGFVESGFEPGLVESGFPSGFFGLGSLVYASSVMRGYICGLARAHMEVTSTMQLG